MPHRFSTELPLLLGLLPLFRAVYGRRSAVPRPRNVVDSAQMPVVSVHYSSKMPLGERPQIVTSQDAFNLLWPLFREQHEVQECFRIILLDRGHRAKGVYTVSQGGLHGTVADPKLIFSVALASLSSAIVLAHNHPSGQCEPSEQDILLTRKLVQAGKLLDIVVLDHIILCGPDSYYSFADNSMMVA